MAILRAPSSRSATVFTAQPRITAATTKVFSSKGSEVLKQPYGVAQLSKSTVDESSYTGKRNS